jgi:hypothetical protein
MGVRPALIATTLLAIVPTAASCIALAKLSSNVFTASCELISLPSCFPRTVHAKINYVQYDLNHCDKACKATMICGFFAVTTPVHKACLKSLGFGSEHQAHEALEAEHDAIRRQGGFVAETHTPDHD